jgi:2-haloacid dehalogenase
MTSVAIRPKAVLFDAYGTLFDVYSVRVLAEESFPGQGAALAALWRDKQIEYTRLRTQSGPNSEYYVPFWQVTCDALRYACKSLHLPLAADVEGRLMAAYNQLTPFAENQAVLQSLKARGVPAGILSNGSPDMLAAAVSSAGFDGLLAPVLSADAVRKFKTAPEVYALGPSALGLKASEILFVSSNCWDACAATWYGYTTLWVNRISSNVDELGVVPTIIGASLKDVLEVFEA